MYPSSISRALCSDGMRCIKPLAPSRNETNSSRVNVGADGAILGICADGSHDQAGIREITGRQQSERVATSRQPSGLVFPRWPGPSGPFRTKTPQRASLSHGPRAGAVLTRPSRLTDTPFQRRGMSFRALNLSAPYFRGESGRALERLLPAIGRPRVSNHPLRNED